MFDLTRVFFLQCRSKSLASGITHSRQPTNTKHFASDQLNDCITPTPKKRNKKRCILCLRIQIVVRASTTQRHRNWREWSRPPEFAKTPWLAPTGSRQVRAWVKVFTCSLSPFVCVCGWSSTRDKAIFFQLISAPTFFVLNPWFPCEYGDGETDMIPR